MSSVDERTGRDVGGCGCGGCGCGAGGSGAGGSGAGGSGAGLAIGSTRPAGPVEVEAGDLDVRGFAREDRHRRILEAVTAMLPGEGFVLANDHDPRPLQAALAEQAGSFGWEYLAQGPDVWRVLISRTTCC